jgi:sugar transferase (PEP-CTERM system associated)
MHKLLRENIPGATLFQLAVELGWLFAAVILAGKLVNPEWNPSDKTVVSAFVFATLIACFNLTFGFYRRAHRLPLGEYVVREFVALCIEFPIAYIIAKLLLGGSLFREGIGFAVLYALCGLIVVRQLVAWPVARALLPRRVLVLGTGPEARSIEASLEGANLPRLELIGFFDLDLIHEVSVSPDRIVSKDASFESTVKRLEVDEIIVAVREQRGGVLPLQALLDCRLRGVQVTDLARFFERVHGRVPIESLKASWLIYGDGPRQSWLRRSIKRSFDLVVVVGLLILALPIMIISALVILLSTGTPLIYRQERVGYKGQTFTVLKFRSMAKNAETDGSAGGAAIDDARVTRFGSFIRRTRIDELPQLINVLKGEMSLVGPRPERPGFVATLTEKIPFYAIRHSVPPGITGWAQVRYSYGGTVEESVKKLEYDLYYVKNNNLFLDLLILLRTVRVVILCEGAR